jgi:hypothetical protein
VLHLRKLTFLPDLSPNGLRLKSPSFIGCTNSAKSARAASLLPLILCAPFGRRGITSWQIAATAPIPRSGSFDFIVSRHVVEDPRRTPTKTGSDETACSLGLSFVSPERDDIAKPDGVSHSFPVATGWARPRMGATSMRKPAIYCHFLPRLLRVVVRALAIDECPPLPVFVGSGSLTFRTMQNPPTP